MLFEKLCKCMKFTLMINVNVYWQKMADGMSKALIKHFLFPSSMLYKGSFYVCKFLKIYFCILLK